MVSDLIEKGYPVKLITRVGERGLSSAVIRGFKEAKGDFLACMDADLSHPPEAIPRLLAPLLRESKVDMVLGSRYVPGAGTDEDWGVIRWLNSKIATVMAKPFTKVKDPMSGFFALPRKVYEKRASLNPIGYKIGLEIMVKCHCKNVVEVPIHFSNRRLGASKLNFREQVNYLKHLKRLADFKYGEFSRFFQFALVGATGLVVDISTFAVLLKLMPLMGARGLAIWMAMTWNFWANRRLTFSYDRQGRLIEQYLRFVVSCGLGAVCSWSVSVILATRLTWFVGHPILAAIIGILAGTVGNFLLSRHWVFRDVSRVPKGS